MYVGKYRELGMKDTSLDSVGTLEWIHQSTSLHDLELYQHSEYTHTHTHTHTYRPIYYTKHRQATQIELV